MGYKRSEVQFFHQDSVKKAIVALSSAKQLLIYCGAGVTIDRTGLGWKQLIANVFADAGGVEVGDPTAEEIEKIASEEDPQRLASMLMQYRLSHEGGFAEVKRFLTPRLQQQLYKSTGWQQGLLTKNIIRLAVGAVRLGRGVTIVTTNYDTYLEQSFDKYVREVAQADSRHLPGLEVQVLGSKPYLRRQSDNSISPVRLIYLHGRVPPPPGQARGRLVVSEIEYSETRSHVVDQLRHLFSARRTGVLIVGSSLTDPPLIEALAFTRARSDRYALMPMSSTPYWNTYELDTVRLAQHMQARCELMSVALLLPDFKYQVAQFCQEALLCMSEGAESFMLTESRSRYGLRLRTWWEAWTQTEMYGSINKPYAVLADKVKELKDKLSPLTPPSDEGPELFKLEVWTRYNPSESSRRLALWASSAGTLTDRDILKYEQLALASSQASIRAFIEGRPQYISLDELQAPGSFARSRWKSFLSVPIYVATSKGQLPVGAVTLASTRRKESSGIRQGQVKQMEGLVEQLIHVGRLILSA